MEKQNRNLILATVLSLAVIMAWTFFFPPAQPDPSLTEAPPAAEAALAPTAGGPGEAGSNGEVAAPTAAPRVAIETPRLKGSLSLMGGRIDDLELLDYKETLDENSPTVRLLKPTDETNAYFASFGWAAATGLAADAVPGPDTLWTLEGDTATLTPSTPVTLAWDNGAGQTFRTVYSVDEDFMFSITQSVTNASGSTIELRPYGLVRRHGQPDSQKFFILHEGVVGMADGKLTELKYDKVEDLDEVAGVPTDTVAVTENGWIGFTDHYWMTTLIPESGTPFNAVQKFLPSHNIYQTESVLPVTSVAAGAETSSTIRFFAGAKEWEVIRHYQNDVGVDRFVDSIDWGWFWFLTKPIFALLHWLHGIIGNMGWSIIALTLILKAIVLPLAYKSYVSMAKMKEIQPEIEKLKERTGDDRMALQQGMMKLYKENKVNPAAGCLPMLVQIPIFFSLYKVIFVTLELRHAPWLGWIQDLSSPDPTSILNLFGLLPWGTPEVGSIFYILSLGILPICLGISMWLQQRLNPTPPDPAQRMVFAWMPWIFMFMLGSFASGLVLYWIANNLITFIQQYVIMASRGQRPDLIGNTFKKKKAAK